MTGFNQLSDTPPFALREAIRIAPRRVFPGESDLPCTFAVTLDQQGCQPLDFTARDQMRPHDPLPYHP
ncbi:MAG: hypothetical protein WB563_19290 [Pseudolabrys sp.]